MAFPTFNDLSSASKYQPPSPEKAKLYPAARKAVESLRDTLLSSEGGFDSDAAAIGAFRKEVGAMLPVAHPDATACSRATDDVRMASTRHRGGARLLGATTGDYMRLVEVKILDLDIALARAITSQP